jgi:hypothetical protein
MLIVVLASWLGIAGTLLKEGKENGLYHLLLEWQTLIGAMIALAAALVAVRPVWRQVAEMRTQSALQTFEYLRSRSILIEQERALASRAMLEASYVDAILQGLRSTQEQRLLEFRENHLKERIEALQTLDADFQRGGFERWGSLDVVRSRNQLDIAISSLKLALIEILSEVFEMRCSDPAQWAVTQAKLRCLRTPDATSVLVENSQAFLEHANAEAVRLRQRLNRLSEKLAKELEV